MEKKTFAKKLRLSRETLQRLEEPNLRQAVGGSGVSCPLCSDAPTCQATCFCTGDGCN